MSELRYIISDASRKVNVESHVLRYWEEELNLEIHRNEMGHRYYTEEDISLLQTVRTLKEQGFQLKAIKMLLPEINNIEHLDPKTMLILREELNDKTIELEEDGSIQAEDAIIKSSGDDKMNQFKMIMNDLIVKALKENNNSLSKDISTCVTHSVIKEMDYLIRVKEEREEERYKRLDETIRNYQRLRHESAVSEESKTKRPKIFFKKRKQVV